MTKFFYPERLLASGVLAANAASLILPTFEPDELLKIKVRIAGYAGANIAQLQFNGDTGTTAYGWRVTTNLAAMTTGAVGAAGGVKVSQGAITGPRTLMEFTVRNKVGQAHGVIWMAADTSEVALPDMTLGAGIWTTTSQITQVTLDGGGNNLLAGTEMQVYGVRSGI